MTRRDFLLGAASAAGAIARPARGAAARPNFLFIFCDDLGWGDLPCYGHQALRAHGGWLVRGDLQMPHTDRLAREGARFTQFYTASAVCSPSRAAVMTGQFPARLGIHDFLASPQLNRRHGVADSLDPAVPTVTRLLEQAGYATGHFGKWHLSSGRDAPRPERYGIQRYDACMSGPGDRPFSSEHIADQSIAFLEAHRGGSFFLNAWLYDPHNPLHPTEEMMAPYKDAGSGWPGQRSAFEIYYGVLTYMDRQVGRILDALGRLGLADNTVVIFSSDNGPESGLIPFISQYGTATTAGPFRGLKRSLYEGGIRTPFIVRWPGHAPAAKVDNDTVIGGVDFLPTVCKLAGVPLPAGLSLDGEDLSPALLGKPRRRTRPLLWENRFPVYGHILDMSPMLAIRDGNWKLLLNPDRSRVELYDIPRDPTEMNNLAERNPAVVKRLSGRLLAWQAALPKGPVDPRAGRNDYPWPR
ncbi:MAG: sulfatase-like hydrolase/transferase [Bryobacterales bacterium]|nr:sulfatase-like hydrolase/transferase [Bryobacterales bacterium]